MKWQSFNTGWSFARTDGTSLSAMFQQTVSAEQVTLPHDASVTTERDGVGSTPGNGFFREENYVYTKLFSLDAAEHGKQVFLLFEGVYQNAFVYVNNSFVGKHAYGYTPFRLDITDAVNFAEENEVKVIVRNGVNSGRWYTGGGICRDVSLAVCDRLHLSGVRLSTVELEEGLAVLEAQADVCYTGAELRKAELEVTLFDAEGREAARSHMPFTVKGGAQETYQRRLYVSAPQTWDAEHPYLYSYRARLLESGTVLDEEEGTFGIRKLSLDPVNGLRVNGKQVLLRGGCVHHDNGILGAVEYREAAERRVRKLKEAGFNAVRSSHYPISRAMLEACDRLGMYVLDEFTDVWTSCKVIFDYSFSLTEHWEEDLTAMVYKDYNHPSVLLYSIGNEIPEVGNRLDVLWGKRFADKIKALDPTRYTTNAINTLLAGMDVLIQLGKKSGAAAAMSSGSGASQRPAEINNAMANLGELIKALVKNPAVTAAISEGCEQLDVVGYNYAAARYEDEAKLNPNRILLGTETNPKDLAVNWALVKKLPNVIGDFDWTAWDYLGETGIGVITYDDEKSAMYAPYPCRTAYCGDLNLIGDRRPISYWRQIVWGSREAPYLCVQPPRSYGKTKHLNGWSKTDAVRSWNWKGFEGQPVRVEVYADAAEAELLINGVSVGRKVIGEEEAYTAFFDTVYVPGTVEAVVYRDGSETGRDSIATAGDGLRLRAEADKTVLRADGRGLSFIELSLTDARGILNPEAVRTVHASADGVRLAGFGSAAPFSEENFYDTAAKPFEGRLLAAVRGCGSAGRGTVTFSGEGLEPVTVEYTLLD